MMIDTIADFLTRIRNGQRAGKKTVCVQSSHMNRHLLDVLKVEGFIQSYEQKENVETGFKQYEVWLKYSNAGEPAISLARRISGSGRRVYSVCKNLPRVFNGLGISVVSTSQGVMSDREARRRKIGGEVLAHIG